jgi:hypothetical protein
MTIFDFELDPAEMDEMASLKIGASAIKNTFPSSPFQNCDDVCWSRHRFAKARYNAMI